MFKGTLSVIALSCFLLLAGCATHIPLSKENSQNIKTVWVNPEIKKPDQMFEHTSASDYGFVVGGLIGELAAAAGDTQSARTIQLSAEKNNIDIRKIVYQQWIEQIGKKSKFKLSNQLHSDAQLISEIKIYGVTNAGAYSRRYVGTLTLHAQLVRANAVVWEDTEYSKVTSDTHKYKFAEIMNDSAKLSVIWNQAAENAVSKLIANLIRQG